MLASFVDAIVAEWAQSIYRRSATAERNPRAFGFDTKSKRIVCRGLPHGLLFLYINKIEITTNG
jgi:hypothetical protein